MANSTIYESFTLPSKGMIYSKPVDPDFTIRSMTTMEEMARQSQSDTPYKQMSDIIEDCLGKKFSIPVYNLCLGDYQFLLHKLRIVTYGKDYKISLTCPNCKKFVTAVGDLNTMDVKEYDESTYLDAVNIVLPENKDRIELKIQTPKDLDDIAFKNREHQKKLKTNVNFGLLYTLISLISKVNGQVLNPITLEEYCKKLNMKDVNFIITSANKLNNLIGFTDDLIAKCKECEYEVVVPFRQTSEFWGPTTDISD